MMKKITSLLLILLLSGCFANEKKEEHNSTHVATEKISSLFTLESINGTKIHINETEGGLSFQEFQNKAVLFVFFGYRCPPCLREVPALIALNNENHKDLEIIALEVQGLDTKGIQDFAKRTGANYTLISSENNNDFINYIIQRANWKGNIPFLLGFDKKGVVQIVHTGGINKAQFDKIYTALTTQEDQNLTQK